MRIAAAVNLVRCLLLLPHVYANQVGVYQDPSAPSGAGHSFAAPAATAESAVAEAELGLLRVEGTVGNGTHWEMWIWLLKPICIPTE